MEEEMATHSSVLAWRVPGTGEPGGLPSMGSHRVRHDWSDLAAAAAAAYHFSRFYIYALIWYSFFSSFKNTAQFLLLLQAFNDQKSRLWTSLGEANGTPLLYSSLENPMDGGAWRAAVHGVLKSRTRLSDFTVTFHFHALEKEMATHSSVLTWRIPGTGKPGGLLSMGSHRVWHNWSDLAAA